ncbi:MAG TPA: BTAD domain-containing putative transcriptional regulator, partial [Burkholderiaceae bacterium]|nr:BTAD domain-containing putative transcriptional regulator [Burkholderiaceae bacterium]
MAVRLILFGTPKIEHDGASLVLPFERRSQLLVLLALRRAWVGRAEVATLLWPELERKLAYSNLRKTLFRLQSVPWGGQIEAQGGAVRFAAETDVFAFESALRENRLAEAISLHVGELLAGFDDGQSEAWSSWLGFERERLRVAWRDAALTRLGAQIDAAEGIALAARLLEVDPLDEAALRAHMMWLARSGQSSRAHQAYRDFVGRLAQDLGLAPSAELQALHAELARTAATATRQAAVSVPPAPPAGGFVGRTIELRRIAALLAQNDCRLVCITGPGGVGKTRLARHALADLAPNLADGGAFIALEDVSSVNEIGGRLARDLGIGLRGSAEPLDQVIEFLRERRMLLVLDNYEQLASAASIPQRLLQACARVKLVVTSRVRLGIAEEWLLPLAGLPCPEMDDADRIEAFDAVRLFFNAARRVDLTLDLSAHAAAIIDICRQVEGLPLALELAAAWTRLLSCAAIAEELRAGTELLRAADGARPPRHASIDVVFEHSWRLLTPVERETLARLAVFRAGFTAAAARVVAGASLPILAALADKSLVRKEEARLFLHPLVQQLAAVRLSGAARAAAEAAHAQYFHGLLAQLEHPVERGDREALAQVETEFDNCRAAWRWAGAHQAAAALAQSLHTVLQFCDHRSRFEEGLSLLSEALDAAASRADVTLEARLSAAVAHLQYRLDRYADAAATATQALELAHAAGSHPAQAQCFQVLGACALRRGQHAEAKRLFMQARRHALAGGDLRKAAGMLDNQALAEKQLGHYDEALRLSLESL